MSDTLTKEGIEKSVADGESFEGQAIKGVDLTGASLQGGKFAETNFRYSILRAANLTGADLRKANLRHVVLSGANLTRADLRGADLSHVNLKGANLTEARLDGANLKGTIGISQNVFFTQEILDNLNAENKIDLDGDRLVVLTSNRPQYLIRPAVRFLKLEEGEDTHHLLGKVKAEEDLAEQGIEVYHSSALAGDTVYQVEPGFLGTPTYDEPADEKDGAQEAAAAETATETETPASDSPAATSDEDLLAEFLLKTLK